MKWTTANVKNPNYTSNHEIYVGTQTGLLKKLVPGNENNPYQATKLNDPSALDKESSVTTLAFANDEHTEILVGRTKPQVDIYSLETDTATSTVHFQKPGTMGLVQFGNTLVRGVVTGEIQQNLLGESDFLPEWTAGDQMQHMRQCAVAKHLIATGGKGRQNNLKVFDLEKGEKPVFSSKNLPNDQLQLEVPVWDTDVGFIDSPHVLATCSRYGYVRVYDTRKQRRPVQNFSTADQMSFTTLEAKGNYIYTGTGMGALKAFDIRKMKNFVHTYKGFTGAISSLCLDGTGKFLTSASFDRYVRVHDVDSTVLLYQCYVKSKASSVLIRESKETLNTEANETEESEGVDRRKTKKAKKEDAVSEDEEYEEIFDKMQTVCEDSVDDDPEDGDADNREEDEKSGEERDAADAADDDDEKDESEAASDNSKKSLSKKRKQDSKKTSFKKKKN